jgi:hypothetical protein
MGFFDFLPGFGGGGGGGGGSSGGGAFGIDTSSRATTETSDVRTAASEGSLAVGAGAKFLEGTDLSGASNVTITTDAAANQTISDLSAGLTNYLQSANESALASQKTSDQLLKEVLTKLTEQSTAQQTGFSSLLISPLFWIVMAGLAVLGLFLWRQR